MVQLDGAVASSSSSSSSSSTSYKDPAVALLLLEVTVRLLFVFRPSNKTDVLRLAKLARHYASGKPVIGVFQATEGIARLDTREPAANYFKRWIHLLVRMAQLMLWQIAVNPTYVDPWCAKWRMRLNALPHRQPSNLLFLELVKQLLDASKYAGLSIPATSKSAIPAQIATRMISKDSFLHIRQHLLAFVSSDTPLRSLID